MADAPTGWTLGLGVALLGVLLGDSVKRGGRLKKAVRERDLSLAALHVSLDASRGECASLAHRAKALERALRESARALQRLHAESLDGDGPLPSLEELDSLQQELRDALMRVRSAKGRALREELDLLDERRKALSLDLSATQMGIEGEERVSQMCHSGHGTPCEMEETDHEDMAMGGARSPPVKWLLAERDEDDRANAAQERGESEQTAFECGDLDQAAGLLCAESEYQESSSDRSWEVERLADER